MRKTRFAATVMWVSILWLTAEAYVGRLIALKERRLFLLALTALNQMP